MTEDPTIGRSALSQTNHGHWNLIEGNTTINYKTTYFLIAMASRQWPAASNNKKLHFLKQTNILSFPKCELNRNYYAAQNVTKMSTPGDLSNTFGLSVGKFQLYLSLVYDNKYVLAQLFRRFKALFFSPPAMALSKQEVQGGGKDTGRGRGAKRSANLTHLWANGWGNFCKSGPERFRVWTRSAGQNKWRHRFSKQLIGLIGF